MSRGGTRIRSLKPEIVEDEVTAGLSDAAFRLFVSLIVLADDYGRVRGSPSWIQAHVWWSARGSRAAATQVIAELEAAGRVLSTGDVDNSGASAGKPGLISTYEIAGQKYIQITGWEKHQRVSNAGASIIPPPPGLPVQGVAPQPAASRGEAEGLAAISGDSPRASAARRSRARPRGSLVPDPGSRVQGPGSTPPAAAEVEPEPEPAIPEPAPTRVPEPERNPDLKVAIDGFHELFRAARGAPPSWDGREVKRMEGLLRRGGGSAGVLARARVMFATAPKFPCEHGGDLRTLADHFDRFASMPTAPRARPGAERGLGAALAAVAEMVASPSEPWKAGA